MTTSARLQLAVLGAMALLAGCTPSDKAALIAGGPASAAELPPNIHVLAADVLVVNGRHLRLADLATPQASPHARCVAEALGARQARLKLVELAQGARAVKIQPTGQRDDHDREIAHVYLDGADPADSLIAEGLAVASNGRRMDWCGPISDAPDGARHIAILSLSGS